MGKKREYWVCFGIVRGFCMKRHGSREDALRCCEFDDTAQTMLWGTGSDREPRRALPGDSWPPTLVEPDGSE